MAFKKVVYKVAFKKVVYKMAFKTETMHSSKTTLVINKVTVYTTWIEKNAGVKRSSTRLGAWPCTRGVDTYQR